MKYLINLIFILCLVYPLTLFAEDEYSFFTEIGGTFSAKSKNNVLDERGGVVRVGFTYNPLFLMFGAMGRGSRSEVPSGDAYSMGNLGVFGGFSFFNNTCFRVRFFFPLAYGRIKPVNGTEWHADDNVLFFEPEFQLLYKVVRNFGFGLGLNYRYIYNYDAKQDQEKDIEGLMFTGSFVLELPF